MISTGIVVLIVVVVLVVVGGLLAVRALSQRRRRTESLRATFGPEYDRTVQGVGGRREAEQDLQERRAQHAALELRPLSEQDREQFRSQWLAVQAHFVDEPVAALSEADALVTRLLHERGYPTGDLTDQEKLLSVRHAGVLDGFRAGHAIEQDSAAARASTEQIRQGMLHFRTVFENMLQDEGGSRRRSP